MVQKCLGILPPVEDRVVFLAGRVARGAAPVKVQHWRGCQHDAHVWELLDLTRTLMAQDQRLMMQILQKNQIPELLCQEQGHVFGMTSTRHDWGLLLTCWFLRSTTSCCSAGVRLRLTYSHLLGGRPAPPEAYRVSYKVAPALVGLRPWSSTSAGTMPPWWCSGRA